MRTLPFVFERLFHLLPVQANYLQSRLSEGEQLDPGSFAGSFHRQKDKDLIPPFECAVHSVKTAACQSREKILPVKVATEISTKRLPEKQLHKVRIKEKLKKQKYCTKASICCCCSSALLVKLDPEVEPVQWRLLIGSVKISSE